jgi:ligand-binding SRPBCC domain-containing protein
MRYHLRRSQYVAAPLAEVYAFFSDPYNLESITPPWLGFSILDATDRPVRKGTRIRYRLRLHGIPLRWESVISEAVDGEMFADEQVTGPYSYWHHEHRFRQEDAGVMIEDHVEYALPLGLLGRIAHTLAVRRQLRRIFDYRHARIAEMFGGAGYVL